MNKTQLLSSLQDVYDNLIIGKEEIAMNILSKIIDELDKETDEDIFSMHIMFNKINDLYPYFKKHPNKEMVVESCMHYLADDNKKWWDEMHKK